VRVFTDIVRRGLPRCSWGIPNCRRLCFGCVSTLSTELTEDCDEGKEGWEKQYESQGSDAEEALVLLSSECWEPESDQTEAVEEEA